LQFKVTARDLLPANNAWVKRGGEKVKKNEATRLLTLNEVAKLLHISKRTVLRRVLDGELAAHRVGYRWRIARVDVEDYLRRHRFGHDPDVL